MDGKRIQSLSEYFDGIPLVSFTPDDLAAIKGAPDVRRTLVDRAVFNRFPAYLSESRDYLRALKNRNRLLKDGASSSVIAPWDETLARLGARLWVRRRNLLAELRPRAREAFARIVASELQADFSYAPAHFEPEAFASATEHSLEEFLLQKHAQLLHRDRERGFTTVGPHADDLTVELGTELARPYASQGQARALVLAWKIAEIENLHAHFDYLPLLLLDDVSSELDQERNAYLMSYIAACGAQTFLTTTMRSLVEGATGPTTRWLRVVGGEVFPDDESAVARTPKLA